ncbi:MAG: hypothetical protein Roseis2KO_28330 [Roseivirga sp.]
MDLALKKIELINWLTKQDESMINKIENLRQGSVEEAYRNRMNENLEAKLSRAQSDIIAGRTYSQSDTQFFN